MKNLFDKKNATKISAGKVLRKCDCCGNSYQADSRNLKRGWGLCCSKSCAATKREQSKPGYNPERVALNNIRRLFWNSHPQYHEESRFGTWRGRRTSEGYKMYERENDAFTAIDEYGDPIYDGYTWEDDAGDSEYWDTKDFD
jgi:hypothetical protein